MKDWTGNSKSFYTTLGASNHTDKARETNDYYATEPKAAELLLEVEDFAPDIWECACGECHLSKVFEAHGYNVKSTDLIYRCEQAVVVLWLMLGMCGKRDIKATQLLSGLIEVKLWMIV